MAKVLTSRLPGLGIRLLSDLGLMQHIVPDVLAMRGMHQFLESVDDGVNVKHGESGDEPGKRLAADIFVLEGATQRRGELIRVAGPEEQRVVITKDFAVRRDI